MAEIERIQQAVREAGGFASTADLPCPRGRIPRLLADGVLVRARRGWYMVPELPEPLATAARLGGRVTGETLFAELGAWRLPGPRPIHIALASTRHRPMLPAHVRLHWSPYATPGLRERTDRAIVHLVRSCRADEAIMVLDSALHRGIVRPSEVSAALEGCASSGGRRVLAQIDGRAESGAETLVRLWLRRARIRARPQVAIGRYRVDFLIGSSLVVEVVGKEYHAPAAAFEADGTREAFLQSRGYVVLRVTAQQVFSRWEEVEGAIRAVVRMGRHRLRTQAAPG